MYEMIICYTKSNQARFIGGKSFDASMLGLGASILKEFSYD